MHNSQLPTDGHQQRKSAFQPDNGLLEAQVQLHGNERIRHLLKFFGLRTSLVRLKVIDALLTAAGNDRRRADSTAARTEIPAVQRRHRLW